MAAQHGLALAMAFVGFFLILGFCMVAWFSRLITYMTATLGHNLMSRDTILSKIFALCVLLPQFFSICVIFFPSSQSAQNF
jgi:hypothetical protein